MLSSKTAAYLNIASFGLSTLSGAAWLAGAMPSNTAVIVMGGIGWVTGIVNFVLHTYPPAPAK